MTCPWDRPHFGQEQHFVLSRAQRRQRWAPHRNGRLRREGGRKSALSRHRDRHERRRVLNHMARSKVRIARILAARRKALAA